MNSIAGGDHSKGSWHYQGNTMDVKCDAPVNHCAVLKNFCRYTNIHHCGQWWWWLSWQSGRFRHQRSAVRIPTSAKFLLNNVYCQLYWKDENKKKRPGVAHFFNIFHCSWLVTGDPGTNNSTFLYLQSMDCIFGLKSPNVFAHRVKANLSIYKCS